MSDRLTMERIVRGQAPGREFDIEYWQRLGPEAIFAAAWEMVVAVHQKEANAGELRLRRSVENFQRVRR